MKLTFPQDWQKFERCFLLFFCDSIMLVSDSKIYYRQFKRNTTLKITQKIILAGTGSKLYNKIDLLQGSRTVLLRELLPSWTVNHKFCLLQHQQKWSPLPNNFSRVILFWSNFHLNDSNWWFPTCRRNWEMHGRKWRRTKESLDESERGEWKSWLKAQHSEN